MNSATIFHMNTVCATIRIHITLTLLSRVTQPLPQCYRLLLPANIEMDAAATPIATTTGRQLTPLLAQVRVPSGRAALVIYYGHAQYHYVLHYCHYTLR